MADNKITIHFETLTVDVDLPDNIDEITDEIVSAAGVEVMRVLNDLRDAEREERVGDEAGAGAQALPVDIAGPIDLACPACGAVVGELCKNAEGLSLPKFHRERSRNADA